MVYVALREGDASFPPDGRSRDCGKVAVAQGDGRELDQESAVSAADNACRRIGFFGLISEWVDQELLVALAGIESCEVVLAGKADVSTGTQPSASSSAASA